MSDTGIHLFNANNQGRWRAMDLPTGGLPNDQDVFSRHTPGGGQVVARRPLSPARIAELFELPVLGRRNMVEDSFGVGGVVVPEGVTPFVYPVMLRTAEPVEVVKRPGVDVTIATTPDELEQAEQVIVEGFPRPEVQPWQPGGFLPKAVLSNPGWRTWLARRDGVPAAAAVSYDDGALLGVYWLATLPAHRGGGLGAALMTAILASRPEMASGLVATKMGLPLYERLGYRPISQGVWYAVSGA
ncbi:GNAT family N-acetyltransferase [Kineosporia sp. NBRC 101677]|uniref:GNAT family N-acetyltransferase n=1 Tax=Kineosporia sp. NBRC 101677 TaxID=3032197 RepID=UPI00255411ED|nr:GNAT family N-acetyltransferase [Kineosporia sp. NBRC 101677]